MVDRVAHGFSRGEREFVFPTSEEMGHPIQGNPPNQR